MKDDRLKDKNAIVLEKKQTNYNKYSNRSKNNSETKWNVNAVVSKDNSETEASMMALLGIE